MSEKLVYIGKIVALDPIPGADFIVLATAVCGEGGKWRGVVKKDQFIMNSPCFVFLPDSLVPVRQDMKFLESSGWRIRMRKFKGMPSEALIMPLDTLIENKGFAIDFNIGSDWTKSFGVKKYMKPVPSNMSGKQLGGFPSFIPKTDEPNYQGVPQEVEKLHGIPYYITEKCDGSSSTAYKYKGHFGVCSRNWELVEDRTNGYWEVVHKYDLQNKLPEGYAIQWETCGPSIQSNPMGLTSITPYAFSVYNIESQRYLEFKELHQFCEIMNFPMAKVVSLGDSFDSSTVDILGEGYYDNGANREGVVVRSKTNVNENNPISFKIINLNYKD